MTDTASNGDKVVCRRSVDTGSLVRGRNVCKTRRAWQLEAEESRREVQNLQDHGLINSVKSQ
jgi:hypothetical protein